MSLELLRGSCLTSLAAGLVATSSLLLLPNLKYTNLAGLQHIMMALLEEGRDISPSLTGASWDLQAARDSTISHLSPGDHNWFGTPGGGFV